MSTLSPPKGVRQASPRRKPARRITELASAAQEDVLVTAIDETLDCASTLTSAQPPSIPFRSFKIALAAFKDLETAPQTLDRSVWSNRLYSTNLRGTLEACQFLGLTDGASAPTAEFEALVSALDTKAWPAALRRVIERSYAPLLASQISTLTAGGLLRVMRTLYRTHGDSTRKCCNFFVQAAREAALETSLLASSRSGWTSGRTADADPNDGRAQDSLAALLMKLPSYDASWSDDVKRLWFGSYNELIQRLKT